jgi:hypothetical protein
MITKPTVVTLSPFVIPPEPLLPIAITQVNYVGIQIETKEIEHHLNDDRSDEVF